LRPDAMRTVFFLALVEVAMLELDIQVDAGGAKTTSIAFRRCPPQTGDRNVSRRFL
jgi:hypothetical protein